MFTALKIASCILKGRIWPARQPPPSQQLLSCSRMSTPLTPTTCSHTPSSFSTSPTIIAANTVTPSPTPGTSTRKCSILSTQFAKCTELLHMSKHYQYIHDARILQPPQQKNIIAKKCMRKQGLTRTHVHKHTHTHTHTPVDNIYGLDGMGFEFRVREEIFCLR